MDLFQPKCFFSWGPTCSQALTLLEVEHKWHCWHRRTPSKMTQNWTWEHFQRAWSYGRGLWSLILTRFSRWLGSERLTVAPLGSASWILFQKVTFTLSKSLFQFIVVGCSVAFKVCCAEWRCLLDRGLIGASMWPNGTFLVLSALSTVSPISIRQ